MGRLISLRSARYWLHQSLGRRTVTFEGLKVICDPSRTGSLVARAIFRGDYEEAERALVREAIRPGDNVLEIGAGVGIVALACRRLVGSGRVVSYEANVDLADVLRENFALNGIEADLRMAAVTRDGAPATFFRDPNVVSSSLIDRGRSAAAVRVDSVSFEDAMLDAAANILVMDVEGAEVELLAQADLRPLREIVVELHPHVVGAEATDRLIGSITAAGFWRRAERHKTVWFSRAPEGQLAT